jgi:hypothetical protein
MKLFLIVCILLSPLCLVAQTTNGGAQVPARDKVQEPKLEDFHFDVDSNGRFRTVVGTPKQMSTLKVSDLPNSNDPPFEIETTVKCATFEALVVENERRGGALARMVPTEVLAAVPTAASSCFARNSIGIRENLRDFLFADIGAMVDAQAELDRREYNELIDKYNSLVEKHNALLTMTRSFASQLAVTQSDLARQQRINSALTIYEFMPKYAPPKTVNIQVTDCTRFPALCVH